MSKTCGKRFYKNNRVILCKKPPEKNTKYWRIASYLKISLRRKGYSPCKGFSLWKMVSLGQKVKRPKTSVKRLYKNMRVVLCKKTAWKNTKYSRFETNLNISHPSKGYSPCQCYSHCKMVSLGQKLKMRKTCEKRFYKNIRVILCKKLLEKKPKYSRTEINLKISY